MYKKPGCLKCNNGYILHTGLQVTPYHSEPGWYERCGCSKIPTKKYQALLDDTSLTRKEYNKKLARYYDNNWKED